MLRIKLQRVGKKHDPSYRVVVTDRRTGPKSNKHVALVGHYDNIRKTITLKKDEIQEWIKKGAQPTDTVHNLLVREGIIKGDKRNVLPLKTPIRKEEEKSEEKTDISSETSEKEEKEKVEESNNEEIIKEDDKKED